MDFTFNINIRFVGTQVQHEVDLIELENAFINLIQSFTRAGEIKVLGGLEGMNIDIKMKPLENVT